MNLRLPDCASDDLAIGEVHGRSRHREGRAVSGHVPRVRRGHLRAPGGGHRADPGAHRRVARGEPPQRLGDGPSDGERGPGGGRPRPSPSPTRAGTSPRWWSAATGWPSGSCPRCSACPWVKVHHEAETWEHMISADVEEAMWRVLGDPKTCPHGNPIPGAGYKPPRMKAISDMGVGRDGQAGADLRGARARGRHDGLPRSGRAPPRGRGAPRPTGHRTAPSPCRWQGRTPSASTSTWRSGSSSPPADSVDRAGMTGALWEPNCRIRRADSVQQNDRAGLAQRRSVNRLWVLAGRFRSRKPEGAWRRTSVRLSLRVRSHRGR